MKNDFKNDTAGCTYKKGIVAESKPGFARVRFDDLDGMTSDWLPTSHANTQDDKDVETLNVGAQVSCLMDARMEDGCIIGAHYSNADAPPVSESTKWHKRFADGTVIEYDKAAQKLVVSVRGSMDAIVDGDALLKAARVTLDTPETLCTGKLTVQGLLTYLAGLAGQSGGGAGTQIQGTVGFTGGALTHDGVDISSTHTHSGVQSGGSRTGPAA